jgi:CTP-dependent riboflavin kinase
MIKVNQKENYTTVKIKGTVKSGSGDSSQWMPVYLPWLFPGTLNVRLEGKKPPLHWIQTIDTHYGNPCKIAQCKINGESAFIILPPMVRETRSKIEIGATFKLREKFNLQDGDQITVEFT